MGRIISCMSDEEKLDTPGGARSGGMVPQQAHANDYAKLIKQVSIQKHAKQLAPKGKPTPQQQPRKDRSGGFER